MSTFFKIQPYKKHSQYSQYSEAEGGKDNIENNENEIAEVEKSLLPKATPQQERTDLKSVPLFTNAQGKPLHCIHCAAWTQGQGVWWSGACMHTGDRKNNKSRCTLEVWEAA